MNLNKPHLPCSQNSLCRIAYDLWQPTRHLGTRLGLCLFFFFPDNVFSIRCIYKPQKLQWKFDKKIIFDDVFSLLKDFTRTLTFLAPSTPSLSWTYTLACHRVTRRVPVTIARLTAIRAVGTIWTSWWRTGKKKRINEFSCRSERC